MKRLRTIGLAMAAAFCAAQANAAGAHRGRSRRSRKPARSPSATANSSIPFSYLDDNQKPIGFAIDICRSIVDAVKKELKLDKLEVNSIR